jgi:hypothetical protein
MTRLLAEKQLENGVQMLSFSISALPLLHLPGHMDWLASTP